MLVILSVLTEPNATVYFAHPGSVIIHLFPRTHISFYYECEPHAKPSKLFLMDGDAFPYS